MPIFALLLPIAIGIGNARPQWPGNRSLKSWWTTKDGPPTTVETNHFCFDYLNRK